MYTQDDYLKLAVEVVERNLEKIISGIYKKGTDNYNKNKIIAQTAFEDYLKNAISKYFRIKTILYNQEPVKLYDFYENLDLKSKAETIDTSNILNLLKISNNIIITGTAGCGKSTLLKHLFLNTLLTTDYIPIFVELRNLNNSELSILDYIYKFLKTLGFNLEEKYLIEAFKNGNLIVLFDGFDEIEEIKREKLTDEILQLSDMYNKNDYIISSRPSEKFIAWNNFHELEVMPMNKTKAMELVKKLNYDVNIKNKFIHEIDDNLFDRHESFLSNPLLLTIMLMTFHQYAEIPDKVHLFYEQAFHTLFSKHDATKSGYKRRKVSKLQSDDFMKVLAGFCLLSYSNSDISFSIEKALKYLVQTKQILNNINFNEAEFFSDLNDAVCIIIKDGLNYTFTHRTFQEYFAARYITDCDDKLQQRILKKIILRSRNDEVFNILFEINRRKLEKNLIIPALNELQKLLNGISNNELHRFIISDMFHQIRISSEKNNSITKVSFILSNSENMYMYKCCNFIHEKYHPIYTDIKINMPHQVTIDEILELTRKDGQEVYQTDCKSLLDNYPKLVYSTLFYNEIKYFEFSLKAYNKILEEYQRHEETIGDILLKYSM